MKKSSILLFPLALCLTFGACHGGQEDEGDVVPAYCNYNGFEPQTKLAFWDHPWYDFILMSGLTSKEPVTYLDMQFYKEFGSKPKLGQVGKIPIDVDPNDCGACLIISTDCVSGYCQEMYFAGEGDFEITKWGKKGEIFSGSLKNAVFFQIDVDDNGYYYYKEDGKIWCVPDYKFSTVIQSVHDYTD